MINKKRYIGVQHTTDLYAWIDTAYAVHPDMKSHTGGSMSFGTGTIHCRSSKQKLNTKSSTEAKIPGISDYLPYNLHLAMFLEHHGYPVLKNIIFQDNQSAIHMETNGRNSCTGNSQHNNVRFFLQKTE